jgi:hypothetical protein
LVRGDAVEIEYARQFLSAADVIKSKVRSFGAGWMRSVFALGLLISLCAPVSAAMVHHPGTRHHVTVHPSQSVVVPPVYKFPGYPPIPPDENRNLDPSTWGGTCNGCAGKKRGDGGLVGRDAVEIAHQVLPSSVLIGSSFGRPASFPN